MFQRSSYHYTGEGKHWWHSEDGSNAHIAHFPSYQQETSLPRGLNGCVADQACLCLLLTRRVLGGQWRDFRRRRRKRSQTKRSWGRCWGRGWGGREHAWARGSVEGHCCPWYACLGILSWTLRMWLNPKAVPGLAVTCIVVNSIQVYRVHPLQTK